MTQIVDFIAYTLFRLGIGLLNALPYRTRIALVGKAFECFVRYSPRYRTVAQKNLLLAFPEKTPEWRATVLKESHRELARLVCDVARMGILNDSWLREHTEFPALAQVKNLLARGNGLLIATGHLGSFELLAQAFRAHCAPVSVVIREFKSPRMNSWWHSMRTAGGNSPIPRNGAFRRIVKGLRDGKAVAVPFDQNVRREHADFVEWFGRKAATTRALALAATLQPQTPIVAISLSPLPDERYRIEVVEIDIADLRENTTLSADELRVAITQRISSVYQDLIRDCPASWFWLHRRWKTTPQPSEETFYSEPLAASEHQV